MNQDSVQHASGVARSTALTAHAEKQGVISLPAKAHDGPQSDWHYAGWGVSLGAADRPIFWYRSKDAKAYQVIYADLSVREADTPPSVTNALPVPARPSQTK
jgi:hypothetical protein